MQLSDLEPVAGVTHRTVPVRGIDVHVAEAGAGPPVVLLHGWPQHWWEWRKVIPDLAADHRVLVPDLRGLGWSSAPPDGPYDKRSLAADVAGLLDAEQLDRVSVFGHDWGGIVAFHLALDHPDRVERLVSFDVPPPWPPRPSLRHLAFPLFATYQVLLATPGLGERALRSSPELVRRMIRLGSGRDARWTTEELDAYARPLQDPARARASALYYRTFLTRELAASAGGPDRSRELKAPALVVFGEASAVARTVGTDTIRGVPVEVVPRAGHFLPEEAPDAVLATIRRMLTSS